MRPIFVACLAALIPLKTAADPSRPNVILIMADDLGAEGLGSYGSTLYTTPNLDRMAEEGARFENAYATPLCTPTRVMLMTGQYPNRTGFTNLISKEKRARLPKTLKTFGTYFKAAGYRTAIAGKWQLGQFDQYSNQPREHGFDEYCLWKWQYANKKSSRYYTPGLWCNAASIDGGVRDFGPRLYVEFILDFMERNRDGPFLVYYPMALVHTPLVSPPEYKDLAYSRYPKGTEKATAQYGHMVTYMDMLVGRILRKVKELGIEENTLIIFTGDNGSPNGIRSRLGDLVLPGGKGNKSEAGTRVPFLARWPGKIPPGARSPFISLVDVLPTIAAVADIRVDGEVDGMDLSHNLFGTEGTDREHVIIPFRDDLWVRDASFRFHDDGSLFYCPITSDRKRYRAKLSERTAYREDRRRLKRILESFKAAVPTHDAGGAVRTIKRHRAKRKVRLSGSGANRTD